MSFTHSITKSWTNGGAPISKVVETAAGQEVNIDESIAGGSTDLELMCGVDVSALKSLFILSDRDLMLQTNDGSSPDNTINLKANQPFHWNAADGYFSNPLTVDVASIFATLAAGDAATLKIRALIDPTP